MIVQHSTQYFNSQAVSKMLHCSVRVLWSLNAYILFTFHETWVAVLSEYVISSGICCLLQFKCGNCKFYACYHIYVPLATCKHLDADVFETPCAFSVQHLQLICFRSCQLICIVDKDMMYVFEVFMRHMDTLNLSHANIFCQQPSGTSC